LVLTSYFFCFLVSTCGIFLFCPPFLEEDVRLVAYYRDCRIGGHWTGLGCFSFVSALGFLCHRIFPECSGLCPGKCLLLFTYPQNNTTDLTKKKTDVLDCLPMHQRQLDMATPPRTHRMHRIQSQDWQSQDPMLKHLTQDTFFC